MQTGHFYLEQLTEAVYLYSNKTNFDTDIVNKKVVQFPELDVSWPTIKSKESVADLVHLFKLGNTQI